jgi:hypothetical protein
MRAEGYPEPGTINRQKYLQNNELQRVPKLYLSFSARRHIWDGLLPSADGQTASTCGIQMTIRTSPYCDPAAAGKPDFSRRSKLGFDPIAS